MDIYGVEIPYKPLSNLELIKYARDLDLDVRGVYMRDSLPPSPLKVEMGITNMNLSGETGSHWVCYFKDGDNKQYFDSYGGPVLQEVRDYLGGPILRNTDIVQEYGTPICGHLCLYLLKSWDNGISYRDALNSLAPTGGVIWSTPLSKELHKRVRKNFPKRYVFVRNVDDIFGADLVDMKALSKENDDYKYILMVIDIFSKFGWALPLKVKTGAVVKEALEQIFKEAKPKKLWCDRGTEFYNQVVKTMLKKKKITLYSTENFEKCSVVERWNLTIKSQLWRYFTANHSHRYVDDLQALIDKYNNTKHRSIKMTPVEARLPINRDKVFRNLYYKKLETLGEQQPKFKVGDNVRLAVQKDQFEKSYIINWSDKVYKIKRVLKTRPIVYIVAYKNKIHKGKFYEQELQKVKTDEWRVEKILDTKIINGKKFEYVKWIEHPASENSWIEA